MDLFTRLSPRPLIGLDDVTPTHADLIVRCVLNPGVFELDGRTGLLLRVCEQPAQEDGWISTIVRDEAVEGGLRVLRFARDDPKLDASDPRVFKHNGNSFLTTLSHLRLAWSDDGIGFSVEPTPALQGLGPYETFGIEDCRITPIDGRFELTFTSVSQFGVAVGRASTKNFRSFERHGLILPPHNKDCALFPRRIDGKYVALHRPSGEGIGGNFIWISRSPDLIHFGEHRCLAMTRRGNWDSARIGANGPPILTQRGWLLLYHGADSENCYRIGAMLLDLDDPSRVLARTDEPIMEPTLDFEKRGFFGNVIFSNGQIVRGDQLTIYYGAADEVVAGAAASISAILERLAHRPAR